MESRSWVAKWMMSMYTLLEVGGPALALRLPCANARDCRQISNMTPSDLCPG